MISSRIRRGVLEIRLHHMFIDATDRVLEALGAYLQGSKKNGFLLDQFIEQNRNKIEKRERPLGGVSCGRCFDLGKVRDALSRAYFSGAVCVPVVWGRFGFRKRRRSIRLGSYSFDRGVIRIHPVLDQPFVPAYVVVGVVYHEMLHHVLGTQNASGRRRVHSAEFKKREAVYINFQRALAWEKANLKKLLRPSHPPDA